MQMHQHGGHVPPPYGPGSLPHDPRFRGPPPYSLADHGPSSSDPRRGHSPQPQPESYSDDFSRTASARGLERNDTIKASKRANLKSKPDVVPLNGTVPKLASISTKASNASSGGQRQLFDPRRDDPMRFPLPVGGRDANNVDAGGQLDSLSMASNSVTSQSRSASGTSAASTDYKNNRWKDKDHLLDYDDADSTASGGNVLVRELKAAYREILKLEGKVQDEEYRARQGKEEEGHDKVDPEESVTQEGVDIYWVELAQSHRS